MWFGTNPYGSWRTTWKPVKCIIREHAVTTRVQRDCVYPTLLRLTCIVPKYPKKLEKTTFYVVQMRGLFLPWFCIISTRPSHRFHVLKLALFVLRTSVTSALSICTLWFSRSTQRTGTLYCSLYQRLQSVPDTNTVAYECALCIDRIQSTFLVSCSARSSIIVLWGTDMFPSSILFRMHANRRAILLLLPRKLCLSHTAFVSVLLLFVQPNTS